MLSPLEGPSEFQKAQMALQSWEGSNVHQIQVEGTFDQCQAMVKEITTGEFADLGAMNSINWARIASQIPYYFSGYFQVVGDEIGRPVDFVVPTGNFGNVLAGYIAKQMGLPIRRLIVATNENDVLNELITTGVYNTNRIVEATTSPSMDIAVASNFERVLFDLLDKDPEKTRDFMDQLKQTKSVSLHDVGLDKADLRALGFAVGTSTAHDRLSTIKAAYRESGILIDPHTADAVSVALDYDWSNGEQVPLICMSTAKPVKFEATMHEALGFTPRRADTRFIGIEALAKERGRFVRLNTRAEVEDYIREHRT
jgi:threonine synthase